VQSKRPWEYSSRSQGSNFSLASREPVAKIPKPATLARRHNSNASANQLNFRNSEQCQRLGKIEGIGPVTATALVAAFGDRSSFKNGRQFAAWLGLVP
jgi:hypothetical protein